MRLPDALRKPEPLLWSTGTGTDVAALFQACVCGDLSAVKALLTREPSLVRCHFAYRTPIYFAVRENQVAVAAYLLDHGADPLGLAVNDSLLEITRDRGYAGMERLLTACLEALHGASTRGEPLAEAIRNRDGARVRALLDEDPTRLHAGDARGNQPIHWAVMSRQLDLVETLVRQGADPNARRADGARPIQLVNGDYHYRGWRDVPKDHPTTPADVLVLLRKLGATVDLCTAAYLGDMPRVLECLREDPAQANRPSEYVSYYLGSGTPLKNAAARGHLDVVRVLLERGADPNLPEEGIAPRGHALYAAVSNGHLEVARVLLEHGAFPNPPVESSADALSMAIDRGGPAMVELLCAHGAARSVELLAHYGDVRTAAAVFDANPALADDPDALACAAGNGHESFVRLMLRHQPGLPKRIGIGARIPALTELLFQHGMDPNHSDWLGITPLHEFARRGDLENAALFVERGARLEARDEDLCSTPLGWAARFNQGTMVSWLLARGAKVSSTDDPPWANPLAWALRRGNRAVVEILRAHGAV